MVLQLEMLRFQQMVRIRWFSMLDCQSAICFTAVIISIKRRFPAPSVRAAGATVLLNEPTYRTCPPCGSSSEKMEGIRGFGFLASAK